MEKIINKNKSKSLFLFVILFFLIITMFGGGTVTANAQTVESNNTVQDIIDNTVFVTFRKGDTVERGKYIIACFYVPNEYYDTANTYGVVIFPKDYGIRYNLTANYHKQSEENGAAIIDVVATKGLEEEDGYGINCGVININETNLSRTFCFIFYSGTVEDIHITNTKLRTPDNKVVYIPNGTLSSGTIVNYSEKDVRRVELKFSIGYSEDFERVKRLILDLCEANEKIKKDPAPFVRVSEHAASSINIVTRVWTASADYWTVYFDLLEKVKKSFDENKIQIPFNQLDVHVKQDK